MTKKYALSLIIIILLPHCAVQAYSMFPAAVDQRAAFGEVQGDHPCHETGSGSPDTSAPADPDCCARPAIGQAVRDSDPSSFMAVMPTWFVTDEGLIPDVESWSGGSSESYAKYRHKNDLTGVVMRN